MIWRRSWLITKKHYSHRKVEVDTLKKSIAARTSQWLPGNVSHFRRASSGLGLRRAT
jgi:hypothetical protein